MNIQARKPKLVVFASTPEFIVQAHELASELGVPMIGPGKGGSPAILPTETDLVLVCGPERMELASAQQPKMSPLFVDFASSALDFRRRFGNKGGDMLIKAVGGANQRVLDATAGLARDAFILASYGCHVTAVEKSAVLSALISDGIQRVQGDPEVASIVSRIRFIKGDAKLLLKNEPHFSWDVIYLDPMFPEKKKSALPKKEMQILHLLFGIPKDESESEDLVARAIGVGRRVVVKRPVKAPHLFKQPAVIFKGETTRFDVYVGS